MPTKKVVKAREIKRLKPPKLKEALVVPSNFKFGQVSSVATKAPITPPPMTTTEAVRSNGRCAR